MPGIAVVMMVGLIGGIAVGLQGPLASLISQRIGMLESVFVIHAGGAIASIVPLLLLEGGGQLGEWQRVPWYALGAGGFGLAVIGAMTYMIPRVGATSALLILIVGQLLIGAVLDHYGWFGVSVRPLELSRLLGVLVMLGGVWLTVR